MSAAVHRRRVVMSSAAFGFSALALTLARNILLVPVYLHFVPLAEYGAWLATGGALVQMLMTDYGLSGVVTQRIAAQFGAGDFTRVREFLVAAIANSVMLGVGLGAVGVAIAAFLPATQGLDAAQVERVMHCFLIAILASTIGIISSTAFAAVRGLQKPALAGMSALAGDFASVAVIVAGLWAGWGLYALAAGMLTRSCIVTASCVSVIAGFTREGAGRAFSWPVSLSLWRDSGKFLITSLAMRLQSQANVLAIGIWAGPSSAAVYGLTVRAHETVLIVLGQFNQAVGPTLAHLRGAGEHARFEDVIRRFLPFVAAAAAVGAACVVVLNPSFVALWVGESVYGGAAVTLVMGFAIWSSSLSSVAYEALLARGEFGYIARGFAWSSLLHVAVLSTLTLIGMVAAPLALGVSTLCSAYLFGRRAGFRFIDVLPLLATLGSAVLAGLLLTWCLPPAHSWWALIAEGSAVALITAVIVLAASPSLRQTLRTELLANLRSLRPT
jgi:O-antigen/teichoic acid export membrane protein